jgi:RNA polymerase sigma factor (sigma-70 family)
MKIEYPGDDYTSRFMALMERDIINLSFKYKIIGYQPWDITQELRFELWKRIPKYNPELSGIRTWAWKVLNNKLKNLNRDTMAQKRVIHYFVIPNNEEVNQTEEE